MTVWPSALWKSMCKGCGFLFPTWQSAALENDRESYATRRSRASESSVPLPFPLLSLVCVQLTVFWNLEKNPAFFLLDNQKVGLAAFSFKQRHWEVVCFWHIKPFSQAEWPGQECVTDVTHTAQTHKKIGKIKYLPTETLTGNTSLINTEFACKIKV